MARLTLALWLAVGLAATPAVQHDPENSQARSISGRVVDADTGAPVSGAHVRAGRAEPVVTDSMGRYRIPSVPPGRVVVSTWGLAAYKVTSLAIPKTVTVPATGGLVNVDFRVRLEASLAGRVVDQFGVPVPGAIVMAVTQEYRRTGQYGGPHELANTLWHFRKGTATTDDQGHYTIDGLWAGRQHWVLAYRPLQYDRAISFAPTDPAARAPVLATTWHPAADTLAAAAPVVLSSLETRENVDVVIRRGPSFCVDALITSDDVPTPLSFSLEDEAVADLGISATTTRPAWRFSGHAGPDGRARLCGLYPGRYRLVAAEALSDWSEGRRGQVVFSIDRADLDDVRVNATYPIHVTGLVDLEGDVQPPEDSPAIALSVMPRIGSGGSTRTLVPGAFSLTMAPGIRYSLGLRQLAPSMYVKALTFNGDDVMHAPLVAEPMSGPGRLRIVLGDDGGSIAATVARAIGSPADEVVVVVLPASVQSPAELSAQLRAQVPDALGGATFDGLAPGDYFVLAVSNPPPSVVQYPSEQVLIDRTPDTLDLLLRSRARGERVEVAAGGRVGVSVAPMSIR